jgi:hypothetical protein
MRRSHTLRVAFVNELTATAQQANRIFHLSAAQKSKPAGVSFVESFSQINLGLAPAQTSSAGRSTFTAHFEGKQTHQ